MRAPDKILFLHYATVKIVFRPHFHAIFEEGQTESVFSLLTYNFVLVVIPSELL